VSDCEWSQPLCPSRGIYGQHGMMGMGLHQKMDPDGSDEGMDRQNPWFRNGSIQDLGPLIGGMFGAQPSMLFFFFCLRCHSLSERRSKDQSLVQGVQAADRVFEFEHMAPQNLVIYQGLSGFITVYHGLSWFIIISPMKWPCENCISIFRHTHMIHIWISSESIPVDLRVHLFDALTPCTWK